MKAEEKITGGQLIALVVMAQLGTEVLSLPHVGSQVAGRDTWLSVLMSGLAAQLSITLMWWLGSRFPKKNFFAYVSLLIGKPIGTLVNVLYGLYYSLSGLLITLLYASILKRWIFVLTPRGYLVFMILIVCGYAATSSLKKLAFISQSFVLFPIVGFVLIVLSGIYGMDAKNLLPVLSNGWYPVLKGIYVAFSAYLGYDLLLYAYPYVQARSKTRLLLAMTIANACTMVFYVAVCLICSTMFSLQQLAVIPEPLVFILRNYKVDILQSIDILFLVFYACVVCATIYVYFFMAAKAFLHLRSEGLSKQHVWVWLIIFGCAIGGFFMTKRSDLLQFANFQDKLSVLFVVVIPIALLLVSGVRGLRRSQG